MQYILSDFKLPTSGKNKSDLLFDLGQFLVNRGSKKMTTVLVVDEAHHLSAEILEEVRLLSNLETDDDKLLQIVLVGQPELNEKLDSIGLRQLKQRIAVRTHLRSLNAEETDRYIQQRLQIAGGSFPDPLFPPDTIEAVYHHSHGLPRLINTICDNALVIAYARRLPTVTPDVVEEVAKEFRLNIISSVEETENAGDLDAQNVTNLPRDLDVNLAGPVSNSSELGIAVNIENERP